mgnify:FL=1
MFDTARFFNVMSKLVVANPLIMQGFGLFYIDSEKLNNNNDLRILEFRVGNPLIMQGFKKPWVCKYLKLKGF